MLNVTADFDSNNLTATSLLFAETAPYKDNTTHLKTQPLAKVVSIILFVVSAAEMVVEAVTPQAS
jgi:hypothetical protein